MALNLDLGVREASTFHQNGSGFFSLNWKSPGTIKEAEFCKGIRLDLKDYNSGKFRLKHALMAGAASVDERMLQLEEMLKGLKPYEVRQHVSPAFKLSNVVNELSERPERLKTDFWISQNDFGPGNRQATNLRSLNMLFIDLDIDKENEKHTAFQQLVTKRLRSLPPEKQAEFVVEALYEDGIPVPSYVVFSGGGLHLKWLFDQPVPASAKPVWDKLEEHLVARCINLGLPADPQVRDASRILRLPGTINQKWDRTVEVAWVNGYSLENCCRYDFNALADGKQIMPWSRQEARELRRVGKVWDDNRKTQAQALADAAAAKSFVEDLKKPHLAIREYLAKDMWHARLQMIQRIVQERFGGAVPVGQRNEFVWLAANCLAWSRGTADDYENDLIHVIQSIAPTFSDSEIHSSAASVTKRIRKGGTDALYRMTNDTFNKLLGITKDDWSGYSSRPTSDVDIGVMGFEKMCNLPFDEYLQEKAKRQSEAARRTNDIRAQANQENRSKAVLMRSQGMTQQEIAERLSVNQATVSRWLS